MVPYIGMSWQQLEGSLPGPTFEDREEFFTRSIRSEHAQSRKLCLENAFAQQRPQKDLRQVNQPLAMAMRAHGGPGLLTHCTQVSSPAAGPPVLQHVFWRPAATQMAEAWGKRAKSQEVL